MSPATAAPKIIVSHQGRRYELRRPETLTADEYGQMVKILRRHKELQDRLNKTGDAKNLIPDVCRLANQTLAIISPELASLKLSLEVTSEILLFYSKQTMPPAAEGGAGP